VPLSSAAIKQAAYFVKEELQQLPIVTQHHKHSWCARGFCLMQIRSIALCVMHTNLCGLVQPYSGRYTYST
jgi:hypothetical protein